MGSHCEIAARVMFVGTFKPCRILAAELEACLQTMFQSQPGSGGPRHAFMEMENDVV